MPSTRERSAGRKSVKRAVAKRVASAATPKRSSPKRAGRGVDGRDAGAAHRSAYDQFKEYEGKRYTGMKIGRGHKWRYDAGDWTEKKVTPDKWEFRYAVTKRRTGKAPEGSGAPVGTAYRWYILAQQIVTKLDANSYTTEMVGLKHKLAHKRAEKETWSASERAQRQRLVQILREMIAELEEPAAETARAPMSVEEPVLLH
jgi:hypothetical protein